MTAPCIEATLRHAGLYRAVPATSLRMLKDPPSQKYNVYVGMHILCRKLNAYHRSLGQHLNAGAMRASMQTCAMPGFLLTCLVSGIKIAFAPTSLG
jgi:hypothetical protein